MNKLTRGTGSVLFTVLLLSCGGGSVEKDTAPQGERSQAQLAEACADVVVVGVGSGVEVESTDSAQAGLPDFAVEKIWLETPAGVETYAFGLYETVKMKAQFKNIGSANTSSSVEVRFYLSKGYKEDSHSEWVRVGTDTIQGSNLQMGNTHTETEGLDLWSNITTLGTYNIVACIDRTQDNNNGNGAITEEHESNNCSTEAVFTVARRSPKERKKFLRTLNQIIND